MAAIVVLGNLAEVALGEPDEDGDYQWTCLACGQMGDVYRPQDEAIADAEIHADLNCEIPS